MYATGWGELKAEIDKLLLESQESFDPRVVANVQDLLEVTCSKCTLPEVSKGFWSTLRFNWNGFEIEVYPDHFEVYHFPNGQIDVWYEMHTPGDTFSPRFMAELPVII